MNSAELKKELSVPIKSFRIYALEEVLKGMSGDAVLAVLEEFQALETDEECLLLFDHAMAAVKRRREPALVLPSLESGAVDFETRFLAAAAPEKLGLLKALPEGQVGEWVPRSLDWLSLEKDPLVLAKLIWKFGPHWPETAFEHLVRCLQSTFLIVRLAAMEVLVRLAPQKLMEQLPGLLTSEDPKVRALAIQGLARVDLDEALLHLSNMLEGSGIHEKSGGIQCAFYLPFDRVKAIFLKFLAMETQPEIIEKAGLIFQINSDPEAPYRIWEVAEESLPQKSALMKKIFAGACRAIEQSGILEHEFEKYRQGLEVWVKKRVAKRVVQEMVARSSVSESAQDLLDSCQSAHTLKGTDLRGLAADLEGWNLPPEVRAKVMESLTSLEKEVFRPGIATAAPPPETELPHDAMIRYLNGFSPAQKTEARKAIENLVRTANSGPELKAAAFRAAQRLEIKEFIVPAEACLKNTNEKLVAAALEYVAEFDPERIFPLIGFFLQSPSIRVKTTAINILKKHDPERAVSMLSALLNSKNPHQQSMALSCMFNFEFSMVRERITDFLKKCLLSEHVELCLSFFRTNPERENLQALYALEQTLLEKKFVELVKDVRAKNIQALLELGILRPEEMKNLEKYLAEQYTFDQERKKSPAAPYSFKSLQAQKALKTGHITPPAEKPPVEKGTIEQWVDWVKSVWPLQ